MSLTKTVELLMGHTKQNCSTFLITAQHFYNEIRRLWYLNNKLNQSNVITPQNKQIETVWQFHFYNIKIDPYTITVSRTQTILILIPTYRELILCLTKLAQCPYFYQFAFRFHSCYIESYCNMLKLFSHSKLWYSDKFYTTMQYVSYTMPIIIAVEPVTEIVHELIALD